MVKMRPLSYLADDFECGEDGFEVSNVKTWHLQIYVAEVTHTFCE